MAFWGESSGGIEDSSSGLPSRQGRNKPEHGGQLAKVTFCDLQWDIHFLVIDVFVVHSEFRSTENCFAFY